MCSPPVSANMGENCFLRDSNLTSVAPTIGPLAGPIKSFAEYVLKEGKEYCQHCPAQTLDIAPSGIHGSEQPNPEH